jgi:hypothetical protein
MPAPKSPLSIIVGFDGSDGAFDAVALGRTLADLTGDDLVVVARSPSPVAGRALPTRAWGGSASASTVVTKPGSRCPAQPSWRGAAGDRCMRSRCSPSRLPRIRCSRRTLLSVIAGET